MEPVEGNVSVGEVVDCIVEQVVPFGAFVRITKTGRKGMIHISELSFNFIKNVNDVISVQDKIKAKVIKIDDKGRVDLSLKQAQERPQKFQNRKIQTQLREIREVKNFQDREEPDSFEKKMASFMKISEAKLTDLNARNSARSGHGRRNNSNQKNNNRD